MPVSSVVINSVSPRGGAPGTTVTVVGTGFGAFTGSVVFEPITTPVTATVVSWTPTQVVFTVPALSSSLKNKTLTIKLSRSDNSDYKTTPFWISPATVDASIEDYQWPKFEAGTTAENTDDPYKAQAADFNRLLDIAKKASNSLSSIDPDNDGIVELAAALDDNGTPRTVADIISLVTSMYGSSVVIREYASGVVLRSPVYQQSDGKVGVATAASETTGPAIGVVTAIDDPSAGFCRVAFAGDVPGYSGLSVGKLYILSTVAGQIVAEDDTLNPGYPMTSGHFIQEIGRAASSSTLFLMVTPEIQGIS